MSRQRTLVCRQNGLPWLIERFNKPEAKFLFLLAEEIDSARLEIEKMNRKQRREFLRKKLNK